MHSRAVVRLQEEALRGREALCDERAARLGEGLRMEDQAVLQEIDRERQPERYGCEDFKK
jgi:hypothetical protein